MSKTYRRKTGDQYWYGFNVSSANHIYPLYCIGLATEDDLEKSIQRDEEWQTWVTRKFHRDNNWGSRTTVIQERSNQEFRANEKRQLHNVTRTLDYDEFEYDPSAELNTRRLGLMYS